jgi:preprotein translocase subunit SecG
VEASSFAVVRREAHRAMPLAGLVMIAVAALTANLGFLAVYWAWGSEIPDWAYNAVSALVEPLLAGALLAVYAWGRRRIQRGVLKSFGGDAGYEVMAQAARRGALRRYNVAMLVLAIVLYIGGELYLSWLSSKLTVDEDEDWNEQAQPSTTEALAVPPSAVTRSALA